MRRASLSTKRPCIGITVGDPSGIGPEIVLKSAAEAEVSAACLPVIIADAKELRRQAAALGFPCDYEVVSEAGEISALAEEPMIFDIPCLSEPVKWGEVSANSGRAAISFIETAARLCLDGRLHAIATAPINKEALRLAGSPFPGHTEMLAQLTGSARQLMCFFAGDLRVVLLSIHMSLAEAVKAVTKDRVLETVLTTHHEMRRFGLPRPRIAVAGLNPHAGENGLFGHEEEEEMRPAIEACRARGIDVSGPFPADTIFLRAARGLYDVVVACYHDQGLIAVKSLAFGEAVNVTLGLPIIRTSVDHGTAFDIAGRGVADHSSMSEAIKLAAKLARITGDRVA